MSWKTLTLDTEAYALLRKAKKPRESFGDVVRRVLNERDQDIDVDAYLEDIFANPLKVDTKLLRQRKANPPRSSRRARSKSHAV